MGQGYYQIDERAAKTAKELNSHYSFEHGKATSEYQSMIDEAQKIADAQKSFVGERHHEKIDRLLDMYARKLAENMNKGFEIDARCPSVLISGCANFPVRKKEKQNAARHKNMEEYREIKKILNRIQSVGMGGISSDEPDALEQLTEKLESLMESQEKMKEANAFYRKHKTLEGCPVLNQIQIEKLSHCMATRYHKTHASQPYEGYTLTNNSAEIRRIKTRIEQLKKMAESDIAGYDFDGGKAIINKEENRLQIFFDERPTKETCASLKRNGFKWAPSKKAWQRQLTANALYALKTFCKENELNLRHHQ